MDAYTGIAPLYDALSGAFLRKPRRAIVRRCAALRLRRVLDVGCGTGVLVRMLQELSPDLLVGLDRSPAMLLAGAAPCAVSCRGKFVLADAAFPPFQPASFDALIYSLILHETSADPAELLLRGFALAPCALVLEWRMPERNLDLLASAWVHGVERLAGKEHYRRFRAFMRAGGLRGLARRVGASVLSEEPLAGNSLVLALLEK